MVTATNVQSERKKLDIEVLMAYTIPLVFSLKKENLYKHVLYQQQTVEIIPNSEYSVINIAYAKLWHPSKNWLSLTQLFCEAGHSSLVPECQQPVLGCFVRTRLFCAMVVSA